MEFLPTEPDRRRQAFLGLLLVGMAGYGALEYLHRPATERIEALESRLAGLQIYNRAGELAASDPELTELESRGASSRAELRALETLLARETELPDLLDAISAEAASSGIRLLLLQPTGAAEEAFYVRRTYDLAVEGAYHDIGYFLSRIASLPRTVKPTGLSLAPREGDAPPGSVQLEARFSIQTYVAPARTAHQEVAPGQ